MSEPWWISAIKGFVIINIVLLTFAYTTLLERKALARMQLRYGPNRAGPYGLLQPNHEPSAIWRDGGRRRAREPVASRPRGAARRRR